MKAVVRVMTRAPRRLRPRADARANASWTGIAMMARSGAPRPASLGAYATLAFTALLAVACRGQAVSETASAPTAAAELLDTRGEQIGLATLVENAAGTHLTVQARSLSPGFHGIHFHAVGRCDPPGFTSAGDHFNPTGRKHGLQNPEGAHAGDLPNLEVDPSGAARYSVETSRVTLRDGPTSLLDADGSAIVIHDRVDDQRTDPSGNSGERVACGVIVKRRAAS